MRDLIASLSRRVRPPALPGARVLKAGGLTAFTMQSHDGEAMVVGEDRRLAHAEGWLRQRLVEAGLTPIVVERASTRQDRGAPVTGF